MPKYIPCTESDIPTWARFDVPRQNQGQTVEVAYATDNPRYRGEADVGDAYKRVTDRSDGAVTWYRLAGQAETSCPHPLPWYMALDGYHCEKCDALTLASAGPMSPEQIAASRLPQDRP